AIGKLLKDRAAGSTATRTCNHHGRKGTKPHGLKDFLRNDNFTSAVTAGLRSKRNAYRVAYTFLQQYAKGSGRGNDSLASHAGLSQAQVQRIIATRGQVAVYGDQILYMTDFA